ncbi:unnamed protein product [Pieris macdunnoughi]|uniref:Uncharacterized protein n=1 Tax=Pieris macdunnoughi TaxID=345717 RepID=A0A821PJB7_9NEOP|nr:unnamed protein product [Pieris macdunnoughi]
MSKGFGALERGERGAGFAGGHLFGERPSPPRPCARRCLCRPPPPPGTLDARASPFPPVIRFATRCLAGRLPLHSPGLIRTAYAPRSTR